MFTIISGSSALMFSYPHLCHMTPVLSAPDRAQTPKPGNEAFFPRQPSAQSLIDLLGHSSSQQLARSDDCDNACGEVLGMTL